MQQILPKSEVRRTMAVTKILFLCGRNQWRSPTAEMIFRDDPRMSVRSAGVSESSRHRLTQKDLQWADWVLVMEKKYRSRILDRFRDLDDLPKIDSLDIPDDYEFMSPELIELLRDSVEHFWLSRIQVAPSEFT